MNHPNNEAFRSWLDGQIRTCEDQRQALFADHRVDESNFEKVRANVYGIFRTVFDAAHKAHDDAEKAHLFFLQKLDEIPANWQTSLDNAQTHGDETKAHLERLKLDAAGQIKAAYLRAQEDAL